MTGGLQCRWVGNNRDTPIPLRMVCHSGDGVVAAVGIVAAVAVVVVVQPVARIVDSLAVRM